jgi:hypothetical protein
MTVLWNQGVKTNVEGLAKRPGITLKHKKDKIFILTVVAMPSDTNVIQKESEKKSEYKNLSTDI